MTDLVYDYISSGVDLLMTASVLSAIIVLLQITNILTNVTALQQANASRVDYYREFNHLDSKSSSMIDIQSFVLRYLDNVKCKIVFAKPNAQGKIGNASYLVVDEGKITWVRFNATTGAYEAPIPFTTEQFINLYAWNASQEWHVVLREDGENINSLWDATASNPYNAFKNNYYDGGSVTGIYAVYSGGE